MAAFQRIILFLTAICSLLSVSATPRALVAVRMSDNLSILISSRADRDLMISSLVPQTLTQNPYVAFVVLVVRRAGPSRRLT